MPENIDVLVIGGGSIGERHVRCFGQTGRANVSLCEIDDDVRSKVAQNYELDHTYTDLDAAVRSTPTAAVICTPAHLHVTMAIQLAEAGAHLLIEKPLSTRLEQTAQLTSLVKRRGLVVSVAYIYRASEALASMRGAILEDRFGKPVQLVYVGGQHFPFYRPAYRDIYYADRATGGGAVQDGLTHVVNSAEWLVGPVTKLAADAEHLMLEGVEVEDTIHVIARHGNVAASYSFNQHQTPNEGTITVICQQGTARYEMHNNRWRWHTTPEEDWHDEQFPPTLRDTNFIAQAHAFLDAVEGKTAPVCTLEESLQTLRVNLAILESADTQTWQTIEPCES